MIRPLFTPRSSQRCLSSFRYFWSLALSMKKTLTYSTQSMSKSFLATFGKSRLSIEPALRARWNDHSAKEILNKGLLSSAALATWPSDPKPIAAPAVAADWRNVRRSSELDMVGTSQEFVFTARVIEAGRAAWRTHYQSGGRHGQPI